MPIIESTIDSGSASYLANREQMLALIAQFRVLEQQVRDASNAKLELFRKRGQLFLRTRNEMLSVIEARAFRDLAGSAEWLGVPVEILTPKDQPAPDLVAVRTGPRQAAQRLRPGRGTGHRQCQGDGPEHRSGIRKLRSTLVFF